ncbi:MAG: hypothetical protein AAF828_00625 [Bacteroidota bacterium]
MQKYLNHQSFLTVLASLVLLLLASCNGEPAIEKVNFFLNGEDIQASDNQPRDPEVAAEVLKVFLGDSIYLVDFSEPATAVRSRSWDYNGDGKPDLQDAEKFKMIVTKSGFTKISLCINEDPADCVSKWIYAEGEGDVVDYTPRFLLNSSYVENPGRNYQLEVATENISEQEQITVSVDGNPVPFDFLDGIISAGISIRGEETNVVLRASTPEAENQAELTVVNANYVKPEPRPQPDVGSSKPPPPAPPPPPSTQLRLANPVQLNVSTKANTYPFRLQTISVQDASEISIKINGLAFSDFTFNGGYLEFTAPLPEEINRVVVQANAARGSAEREFKVTRIEDAPAPPPPTPKPPVVVEVPKEDKSGVNWLAPGRLYAAQLEECNDYSISSGSVKVSPKRDNIALRGAKVYASACGSITFKLSINPGDANAVSETIELVPGMNNLTFGTLSDKGLLKGDYHLSYTVGTSRNCSTGTPQLLDLNACGRTSSGDGMVGLRYDKGQVGVSHIKYEYF